MTLDKDVYRYPITWSFLYLVVIFGIASIGNTHRSFDNHYIHLIYRLFIYKDSFTYFLVGVYFYVFRKLELFYGSYSYMSILFTCIVFILPFKVLLSFWISPASFCISLISSLFICYWTTIPLLKNDSIILYKSFRINIRVLLAILLLLIVFGDSFSGCIDFLLGSLIGYFISTILLPKHFLLPFPSFLTYGLIYINKLMFQEQRTREWSSDSETPLFTGRIPYHDYDSHEIMNIQENELNADDVESLMSLGFSRMESEIALRSCGNNVNEAAEKLLSTV